MKEFNRDGRVLQFGYVLLWPDGTVQAFSFASNRHDSWASICTDLPGRNCQLSQRRGRDSRPMVRCR
jgi:hypothetical protein